jgi:hypothetical protein
MNIPQYMADVNCGVMGDILFSNGGQSYIVPVKKKNGSKKIRENKRLEAEGIFGHTSTVPEMIMGDVGRFVRLSPL